ncbi:MerR family transcriptional regulator [Vibrio fluminensis]|uniref:MerR family transcriptional regulator n=1 Tax=Vibrio fluminensis TaxID=2783614 RepID=UPI0018870F4D|nr:MerR family transcriptional regulator [Vibrio fluminensis]
MYIKQASQLTGATQRAIRLYESLGLLEVARTGKYRIYSQANLNLIKIIKEAQALGIHLSDMVEMKNSQDDFDWQLVHDFLIDKHQQVEKQIIELKQQQRRIEACRASIDKCLKGVDSYP